ncbi:MAG: hypothetical protein RSE41_05875 [Clostridia bacterium]
MRNYVDGTSARKLEVQQKRKKVAKKIVINKNNKISYKTVLMCICMFSLILLLSYRYNIISEHNVKVQELKQTLSNVESNLAATNIDVAKATDLLKVEAYAKQKLGMQKPDKNQIIYIDTSKDNAIVKSNNNIFDIIKNKITNIFK